MNYLQFMPEVKDSHKCEVIKLWSTAQELTALSVGISFAKSSSCFAM
jgi:hypothetical protein